MQALRRALAAVAAAALIMSPAAYAEAGKPVPEIVADSAMVVDMKSGTVLYDKHMHKKKYPASTTKVMTALLTIENLDMDDRVTVDAEASFTEGSRIYLLEGEVLTVRELFYALLLPSANDAAVALAKEISGSTEAFAELMNSRARELGALDTNFVNPHGLTDENHLTSAYDLALIATEAMRHEAFREAVSTYSYTIPATNMQETRYLYNSNRLLYDETHEVVYEGASRDIKYEDATGIKTGYTSLAGSCLVAGAERDGTELVAVMMQSTSGALYLDAISLLEYGFSNYRSVLALEEGAGTGEIDVRRGAVGSVGTRADGDGWVSLPADASESELVVSAELEPFLTAPVREGDKAGEIRILRGDGLLKTIDIVADGDVGEGGPLSYIGITDAAAGIMLRTALIALAALAAIAAAYIALRRRQLRRRRSRRAERAARMEERAKADSESRRRL
ncbi:MAG: D-alanyl-D-alanine carboxypeptidase [Clostridiales Family XIII bacterium]|jgi:D-alanyl-D-alanine carboxypeptidase (penicillin-binding protein 5/6)|nr:D-alanyl-D-alanine carboxypeptidase [Clostridiales Family XIII bacterium]